MAVLLAVAILAILVFATAQGRTAVKTALFLPQVLPTIPVKPQEWFTGEPRLEEVSYPTGDGFGVADLYTPAGDGTYGAVLLFLGVNPAGRDDPRVVGLAEGLAQAGVVVLIPWSQEMTQKKVSAGEIESLVYAYEYLLENDRVDPERSGMGGFCVGASFATVAAQDVRIRDRVKFVNFFGGYFDAKDLTVSVTSASRFYGDALEPWMPDKLSVEVVSAHLIDGLPDSGERALLERVFIEKDAVLDGGILSEMSTEAQTVHRLLSGVSRSEADGLISGLPDEMRTELASISPTTMLQDLNARVLIMHDRQDKLVPSEESRRLADALSERGGVYHTEFSLFQHVDPTRPVSPPIYVRELFKLYLHMYNVLRELD